MNYGYMYNNLNLELKDFEGLQQYSMAHFKKVNKYVKRTSFYFIIM